MKIEYEHARNRHSMDGPAVAFPYLRRCLPDSAQSLIDVGCGTGTWLRAALENGLTDVMGIEGIIAPLDQLVIPPSLILQRDLTVPLNVGRHVDVALCLEVAEHLDEESADVLVGSLVDLADTIVFSAACPGQDGQHHVNCQWPVYWQGLFNSRGFACDDAIRWTIWDMLRVEPWYRQNMFVASRDPQHAGHEKRIPGVLHPELVRQPSELLKWIAGGGMPVAWYLSAPLTAMAGKLSRCMHRPTSHD